MNICKILSWNIRGMKKSKNKRNLRDLIRKLGPNIICVQETLMSVFLDKVLEQICNEGNVKAIYQAASGHSGGLLICWDSELYDLCSYESMHHCLGITLKDINTGKLICIFNIYGPQHSGMKKDFWKKLNHIHEIYKNRPCIFVEDFNCVRNSREMMNCSSLNLDYIHFNKWIKDSNLIEVLLG